MEIERSKSANDGSASKSVMCFRLRRSVRSKTDTRYLTEWDMTSSSTFRRVMHELYAALNEPYSLEMYFADGVLYVSIAASPAAITIIKPAIYGYFPSVEIEDLPDYTLSIQANDEVLSAEVALTHNPVLPFLDSSIYAYTTSEPFINSLQLIPIGDRLMYQVVCYPAHDSLLLNMELRISRWFERIGRWVKPRLLFRRGLPNETDKKIRDKCSSRLYWTSMRVVAFKNMESNSSPSDRKETRARLRGHLYQMLRPISAFNSENENGLHYRSIRSGKVVRELVQKRAMIRPFLASIREIATLWNIPSLNMVPSSPMVLSRSLPVPAQLPGSQANSNSVIVLGQATYREQRKEVGIYRSDNVHHVFIVGKAGTGKTRLLSQLCTSEIEAGTTVLVIDRSGELSQSLLERIPEERRSDILLLDPAETSYPAAWNLFGGELIIQRVVAGYRFVEAVKRSLQLSWTETNEVTLRAAIRVVAADQNASLISLHQFFCDSDYRLKLVGRFEDAAVKRIWGRLAPFPPEQQEFIDAVTKFIERLVATNMLRNVFGQGENRFLLSEMVSKRRVVIFKLSSALLGHEIADFLTTVILEELHTLIMSQSATPPEARRKIFVALDTIGHAAQSRIPELVSEGRKGGLALALCTKQLSDLTEHTKEAMLTNVGNLISFGATLADAAVFTKSFNGLVPDYEIVNQPIGHFYAKLTVEGSPVDPVSVRLTDTVKGQRVEAGECRSEALRRSGHPVERVRCLQAPGLTGAGRFLFAEGERSPSTNVAVSTSDGVFPLQEMAFNGPH